MTAHQTEHVFQTVNRRVSVTSHQPYSYRTTQAEQQKQTNCQRVPGRHAAKCNKQWHRADKDKKVIQRLVKEEPAFADPRASKQVIRNRRRRMQDAIEQV